MVAKFSKFGKRKKRLFESAAIVYMVFGVVLLGILGFFVYQNIKMAQKRSVLENRLQELQGRLGELSAQNEVLEASIANTQTEEYQEKILRERGLYKREGEQVVTILPPEPAAESAPLPLRQKRVWWNPFTW